MIPHLLLNPVFKDPDITCIYTTMVPSLTATTERTFKGSGSVSTHMYDHKLHNSSSGLHASLTYCLAPWLTKGLHMVTIV